MTGYIYHLICPIKNQPVYVGSTQNPWTRGIAHKILIGKSSNEMYKYFEETGAVPVFEIIDEVEYSKREELNETEFKWIGDYMKLGYELFNRHGIGKEKIKYKIATIKEDLHLRMKIASAEKGISMVDYLGQAIIEKLKRESK